MCFSPVKLENISPKQVFPFLTATNVCLTLSKFFNVSLPVFCCSFPLIRNKTWTKDLQYTGSAVYIHIQSVVGLIKSVTSSGAPPAVGTLGTISLSTLAVIYCDGFVIACNLFVYGIINFIMNSVFSTAGEIRVTKCRDIRGKFLLLHLYSQKRDIRPFREKLIWIRVDKSCLKNACCTLQDRMNHSAVVFCSWDL